MCFAKQSCICFENGFLTCQDNDAHDDPDDPGYIPGMYDKSNNYWHFLRDEVPTSKQNGNLNFLDEIQKQLEKRGSLKEYNCQTVEHTNKILRTITATQITRRFTKKHEGTLARETLKVFRRNAVLQLIYDKIKKAVDEGKIWLP